MGAMTFDMLNERARVCGSIAANAALLAQYDGTYCAIRDRAADDGDTAAAWLDYGRAMLRHHGLACIDCALLKAGRAVGTYDPTAAMQARRDWTRLARMTGHALIAGRIVADVGGLGCDECDYLAAVATHDYWHNDASATRLRAATLAMVARYPVADAPRSAAWDRVVQTQGGVAWLIT